MPNESDQSFATLLSGALNDVRELFRQEIALAKYEVRQDVNRATSAIGSLVGGGVVLFYGVLLLLTFLALGFAALVAWPPWAGFLVVGGILAIIGLGLLARGRARMRKVNMVPGQTVETVKEDVRWVKQRTTSGRG